jgi:Rieske Fe-S protein
MATVQETHGEEGTDGVRRRDFIHIAAVSFAGVGAAAVVAPLVYQMSPSADVLAQSSTEIDISAIQPGMAIKASWQKQPVFVRNLTPTEIAEANAVPLTDLLDPQTLSERTKPGKENWLITLGVWVACRWAPQRVKIVATSAAISARAMVRTMIRLPASARARPRPIWSCHPMNSRPTQSSKSAEE